MIETYLAPHLGQRGRHPQRWRTLILNASKVDDNTAAGGGGDIADDTDGMGEGLPGDITTSFLGFRARYVPDGAGTARQLSGDAFADRVGDHLVSLRSAVLANQRGGHAAVAHPIHEFAQAGQVRRGCHL